MRKAIAKRKTKETDIIVKINVDGNGKYKIDTGIGILNHMLELFAFHGLFDLEIKASGDLKKIDIHHTNEDTGMVLGEAFKKALGKKIGINRSGDCSIPMDEVLANVSLDISGRGSFNLKMGVGQSSYEQVMSQDGYDLTYAQHFLETFAKSLGMNLNIMVYSPSRDLHTTLEPIFKALGKALKQATQIDPRRKGVPSTKGVID